jgi:hypothetical protein
MAGLIDTDTGLCFGAGLAFERGLGGPLGLEIAVPPAGDTMVSEAGVTMISETSVTMITEGV